MSAAAARLGDPISHSSAMGGLLTGLLVGGAAAVAGAAILGTGGLAAVAMVGAGASAGAGIGQLLGSLNAMSSETGKITSASPNVRINGIPAARASADYVDCSKHSHGRQPIAEGSGGVRINGSPAARVGDRTACDAKISSGSSNVNIGGGTVQTDEINPEVPAWLEWTIAGVGIASAFTLASPAVATMGLVGGAGGGAGGHWLGGQMFGDGSDGQKLMALGGAMLGGFAGAKGAQAIGTRKVVPPENLSEELAPTKLHSLSEIVGKDTADGWIAGARNKAAENRLDISGFTQDEVGAIYGYTTNKGYTMLNPALRGQTKLTSELESFSTHLTNGLSKMEPTPGVYSRGSTPPSHVMEEYRIGNMVSDSAFKSTSKIESEGFNGKLQEKIFSHSGRDVSKLSAYQYEEEVLHLPGTKFMVENNIDQGGITKVLLREVP